MTDITKRLLELDSTLTLHNEGDWKNPFDPSKSGYASFNDAGIEVETGEFLYGLVRVLKPSRVLETGTHWGIGASYMGMALQENKSGYLDTVEFLPEIYERAKQRLTQLGLWASLPSGTVKGYLMDVKDFIPHPNVSYQLILLDTEPQTRFAELLKFYPYLEEGGFVFIHDLHHHMHQIENTEHGFAWPYGKLPQEIIDLVTSGKLLPMHFPTPRGLTGFYKPRKDDFFKKEGYI